MAKINLNIDLCAQLRNKVNEYQHYSITKTHSIAKDNKNNRGWEKICAIMDRLDDTVFYLNSLEIKKEHNRTAIFDFYNFMNHAASLIDCIRYLAEIYDFDLTVENQSTCFFNQLGNTGKGTDKDYFEYLRSLCSVHPIQTDRHPEYKDPNTKIECSPYVRWNEDFLSVPKECDLLAIVYTDNPNEFAKHIGIKLSEIFSYVEYRYNLLQKIIPHIDAYYKNIKTDFTKIPLKPLSEFDSFPEYIEYLKNEFDLRVSTDWDGTFDFYKLTMETHFDHPQNQKLLEIYQNSVKYAFTFLHKYLQELPEDDKYETTGLHKQPDHTTGDCLFFQVSELYIDDELKDFDYPLRKLNLLCFPPCTYDYFSISSFVRMAKPFWEKYVYIETCLPPFEIGLLVQIACHFYKLEHDKSFMNDIPNTEEYRILI